MFCKLWDIRTIVWVLLDKRLILADRLWTSAIACAVFNGSLTTNCP